MFVERESDCGLRIANCGFLQANPKSEIRNPKSKRRGLSLTEVLISMGILTLGLLGVASVFPVGSFYMQKAEISDKGSAIAQSVMNDIMARGILNPRSWLVMMPYPTTTTANLPNFSFNGIDGKFAPSGAATPGTFVRPLAEALSEGLKRTTDPVVLAKQFGSAFVIDPMFVAAGGTSSLGQLNMPAYPFPATAYLVYPWTTTGPYYNTSAWNPWRATWPIRRVTLQQANGWALDKVTAESLFRGNDDLSVDFPARDDRPGIQTWDTNTATSGSTVPLARKWAGEYSWIVSVVPATTEARDGMVRNPQGFAYDVSVVVFYKRSLPTAPAAVSTQMADVASHERMVGSKIISTGMNGGEILLTDLGDGVDLSVPPKPVSPFGQLKAGNWIMLCGPHPNSSLTAPRFVLNWYQVVSIEGKESKLNDQGTTNPAPSSGDPDRRLVTVRGAQWPWQPAANLTDNTQLSNDLCVGIFRGAVAVHTKSIRLESPSAMGTARLHDNLTGQITPPPYDAH